MPYPPPGGWPPPCSRRSSAYGVVATALQPEDPRLRPVIGGGRRDGLAGAVDVSWDGGTDTPVSRECALFPGNSTQWNADLLRGSQGPGHGADTPRPSQPVTWSHAHRPSRPVQCQGAPDRAEGPTGQSVNMNCMVRRRAPGQPRAPTHLGGRDITWHHVTLPNRGPLPTTSADRASPACGVPPAIAWR